MDDKVADARGQPRRSLPLISAREEATLPGFEMMLTGACNNRCGYCSTAWDLMEGREIKVVPRDVARAELERAYARGARRVVFAGGEPTLRRDLGEIVDDARAVGFEGRIVFTHARTAASRAGASWLAGMDTTSFHVSVQGGTAAAHDASVGVRGAFEQTTAGIRNLKAHGKRIRVNGVLTVDLLDSLDAFAALMLELRPDAVGIDSVRPWEGFDPGRASYAALVPPFSRYGQTIARALLTMERAGLTARATAVPPCFVPGAEHLVSQEVQDVDTIDLKRAVAPKYGQIRGQVKAPACAGCAYDARCPGIYARYAEIHGTDELRPIAAVRPRAPAHSPALPAALEPPLALALRRQLVREIGAAGVREVRAITDGTYELACYGPRGEVVVVLSEGGGGPDYATVGRFSVRYRRDPANPDVDLRLVDAVVRLLRRVEPLLARG
jgi:cyclic pyranopterin phosphate synthase